MGDKGQCEISRDNNDTAKGQRLYFFSPPKGPDSILVSLSLCNRYSGASYKPAATV